MMSRLSYLAEGAGAVRRAFSMEASAIGDWIDNAARTLASATSRRSVLKALAVTATGGIFTMLGGASAQAKPKCRDEGHPCEGNQDCCTGLACLQAPGPGKSMRCAVPPCKSAGESCGPNSACCTGSTCIDGKCCKSAKVCGDHNPICCDSGSQCVGHTCCPTARVCRGAADSTGTINEMCCNGDQVCCQGRGSVGGLEVICCGPGAVCDIDFSNEQRPVCRTGGLACGPLACDPANEHCCDNGGTAFNCCPNIESCCAPGICCGPGTTCVNKNCVACVPGNQPCSSGTTPCCNGSCINGVCACTVATGTCVSDANCCSQSCRNGQCVATDNGGPCAVNADCKSGACDPVSGRCH